MCYTVITALAGTTWDVCSHRLEGGLTSTVLSNMLVGTKVAGQKDKDKDTVLPILILA